MRQTPPPAKPFVDLSDEQVHWDLTDSLSYSQYLNLGKLLDAQHPLSYQHDEMLFIIIHQVSELWMKLCLHELGATVDCVRRDDLGPTFKMLARVSTIQQQLLQSWDVLATITPYDYSAFRNSLGKSSGFQSCQYRLLEFLVGNKNADAIKVFSADPPSYQLLERALRAPSLYDEVLRLLSRRGLDIPAEAIDRAVMERTARAAVAICAFDWADIGAWDEVWRLSGRDGAQNAVRGDVSLIDARGSLVWSDGPAVAAIGVEDLVIVATREAVLVVPRSRAQEVRAAAERQARRGSGD